MALIQCKNCGKEISDRATKCPNCGEVLEEVIQEPTAPVCEECGEPLPEGVEVCPDCGCPILVEQEEAPQKVTVAAVDLPKMNKSTKTKVLVAIGAIIVAIILAFVGYKMYQDGQAKKAASEYSVNLFLASDLMLSGASDAESAGNLIKQVWYNSIYEERDSETDKYTRPNGYFVSDFNTALGNLFSDSDFARKTLAIKLNQESVVQVMKDLKNPPEGYEDAYSAIKEYYSAYTTLTNLVVDPSGSLQTFSANFNDADSEVLNRYKAMKLYLD